MIEARKLVKQPLGDHAEVERNLRSVTNLSKFKVEKSPHYVMLHDTSDVRVGRRTRAQARIELLETVYESYFMKFALDGIVLERPEEHLMVLLFADDLSAESRVKVFTESFGELQSLEQEFNVFMKSLKSDVDRLREAAK